MCFVMCPLFFTSRVSFPRLLVRSTIHPFLLLIAFYSTGGVASLRHGDELGCGPSCNIINPELSAARTTVPDDNAKIMPRAGDQMASDSRQTAELELSYRYAAQQKRPWGDSTAWRELWEADRSWELKEANARSAQLPQNGRHATANRYALSAMGGVVGETLVNGFGLVSTFLCRFSRFFTVQPS